MRQYITGLGDGVYATLVGRSIRLTTSSCSEYCSEPYASNVIYLDPDTLANLLRYIEEIKKGEGNEHTRCKGGGDGQV